MSLKQSRFISTENASIPYQEKERKVGFSGSGKTTTVVTIGIQNSDSSIWRTVFAVVVTFGTGVLSSRGRTKISGGDIDGLSVCRQRNRRHSSVLSVPYFPSLRYDLSPRFLSISLDLSLFLFLARTTAG